MGALLLLMHGKGEEGTVRRGCLPRKAAKAMLRGLEAGEEGGHKK